LRAAATTSPSRRKLYDAGYEAGVQAVESKYHGSGDFHNADGTPSWHEIATFCPRHDDRLRGNELQFVRDMASPTVWREPTERQAKWLRSIFHGLGGRI
jgi:hypothetical protein